MSYVDDLEQERGALAALVQQREEIEIKIAEKQERVALLARLCKEPDVEELTGIEGSGLTEACRTALRTAPERGLSLDGVISMLEFLGFPIDNYKNAEAVVHTTLTRLRENEEVGMVMLPSGKKGWKWIGERLGARHKGKFQSRFKSKFSK